MRDMQTNLRDVCFTVTPDNKVQIPIKSKCAGLPYIQGEKTRKILF
jgi:hypothetical protein